ncbi:hypothetical protein [Bradyrhizobium sp. BR 1432]|uniref:hypothetical protein n=1 Tax=Bradyrhizobium sp. BR 1432 TaxID=3447966 RepID=UPI003EE61E4B
MFRDALGWEITQDGRQFLSAIEKAVAGQRARPQSTIDFSSSEVAAQTVTDATKITHSSAQPPSEAAATQERRIQSTHSVTQQSPRLPPRLRTRAALISGKVLSFSRSIDQIDSDC